MKTKESQDVRKRRARTILKRLKKRYPSATTALHYSNPLQLLVSTILSAQCTDARVNMVTPGLFERYPSARDFADADQTELESMIRSTGFFRSKAKNILGATKAIVGEHNGVVPASMEALTALPGVGRKTANCVLGGAFGIQSGIVVDTHVLRLSQRLGLSSNDSPEKVEADLLPLVPKNSWYEFSNLLILHGRETCNARSPKCDVCMILDLCPYPKSRTRPLNSRKAQSR